MFKPTKQPLYPTMILKDIFQATKVRIYPPPPKEYQFQSFCNKGTNKMKSDLLTKYGI